MNCAGENNGGIFSSTEISANGFERATERNPVSVIRSVNAKLLAAGTCLGRHYFGPPLAKLGFGLLGHGPSHVFRQSDIFDFHRRHSDSHRFGPPVNYILI